MRSTLFRKQQLTYFIDLDAYCITDAILRHDDEEKVAHKKLTETLGIILTTLCISPAEHKIMIASRTLTPAVLEHYAQHLSGYYTLKERPITAYFALAATSTDTKAGFTDFIASHALTTKTTAFLKVPKPSISGTGISVDYIDLKDCRFVSNEYQAFIENDTLRDHTHRIKTDGSDLCDTTIIALRTGNVSHLCDYVSPEAMKLSKT